MIPSFVECLARDGYERVQTTKIGSVIKQNGADLRAVRPKKGSAELCVNARTLTVSIDVTTVRLGRLLSPFPACLPSDTLSIFQDDVTVQRGIWEVPLTALVSLKVGSTIQGSGEDTGGPVAPLSPCGTAHSPSPHITVLA